MIQLGNIAESGTLAAALLLAGHVGLYDKLSRIEAYAYGTSAIGAGLTHYCLRSDQADAAMAFWLLAGLGGATVAACYKAREILREERQQGMLAGGLTWPAHDILQSLKS